MRLALTVVCTGADEKPAAAAHSVLFSAGCDQCKRRTASGGQWTDRISCVAPEEFAQSVKTLVEMGQALSAAAAEPHQRISSVSWSCARIWRSSLSRIKI